MKKGKIIAKLGFLFIAGLVLGSHEARADESVTAEYSNDQLSVVLKNNSPKLMAAVWGEENGQNDIRWYSMNHDGEYAKLATSLASHHESGNYQVHIYDFQTGSPVFVAATQLSVDLNVTGQTQVTNVNDETGSYQVTFTPTKNANLIKEVYVPSWTAKDGQNDVVWHKAVKNGDVWQVTIDSSEHNYETGEYISHVYVQDISGSMQIMDHFSQNVNATQSLELSALPSTNQMAVALSLDNYRTANPNLKFAVWGEKDGQNDIQWLTPQQSGNRWLVNMDVPTHHETGKYQVHVYDFKTGKPKLVTTTTFELSPITSTDIQVINQDDDNQTFDITFPKVESPAGITGVKVAVWSEESGQDDLHWYDAQLNGDQYQVHVDTANHKDSIGTYHIHAYASDNRRLFQIVGFTEIKVNDSNAAPSIQANVNGDQESVTVTLKHWRKGGEVLLPTWGDKGGQNDIQWYQAEKIGQSTWRGTVHLGNHMELGKYEVHAYSRENGKMNFIANQTFDVQKIKSNFLTFEQKDSNAATFVAKLNNVLADKPLKGVRFAVWTDHKGQDDLKWYQASKNNHSYQVKIDARNHNYESGQYVVHAYLDYQDGSSQLVTYTNTDFKVNGRRYQNPAPYYQIVDKINIGNSGYNISYGFEGLKVAKVIQKLGAGTYVGMGGAFFGPRTQAAVRNFQARSGLPVNGVVDLRTWKAMGLSESDWYNVGSYVSPMRVNRNSSRQDHIEAMISRAYDYLGDPYVIGASGAPGLGLDCSGLVMQGLFAAGLDMSPINPIRHAQPGYEYESRNMWASPKLMKVPYANRQRGDLIFYHDGNGVVIHVAIYLGNNRVIESWPNSVMVSAVVDGKHPYILGVGRPFI